VITNGFHDQDSLSLILILLATKRYSSERAADILSNAKVPWTVAERIVSGDCDEQAAGRNYNESPKECVPIGLKTTLVSALMR